MTPQDCKYLPFATPAAAQSRNNQMARSMRCDIIKTLYWYGQLDLTDGTSVLIIQPDGSGYYDSESGPAALSRLTPNEVASLLTYAQIEGRLPPAGSLPPFIAVPP